MMMMMMMMMINNIKTGRKLYQLNTFKMYGLRDRDRDTREIQIDPRTDYITSSSGWPCL